MKKIISLLLSVIMIILLCPFNIFAESPEEPYWYVPEGKDRRVFEDACNKMLSGIKDNDSLTDVEKALLIHDRLIVHGEYDLTDERHFAYDVMVDKIGVCQSYAYAYKYMLNQVGVECGFEVSERLDGNGHIWNIVTIDSKKYYVDVTWDDPSYDRTGRVRHNNFLVSSQTLYENQHEADDFDMSFTNTEYENEPWVNSYAEFQLINGKIYYIDNINCTLNEYPSGNVLCNLSDEKEWIIEKNPTDYKYTECCSCLSNDGTNLYFSDTKYIKKYDIETKEVTTVFTPYQPQGTYKNIFGFTCDRERNVFLYELHSTPNYEEDTKAQIIKSACIGEHTYSNDCDETCNVCDNVRTPYHTFNDSWSADDTVHWHNCAYCSAKNGISEHIYDNTCDTTCNICGYTRDITHTYGSVWGNNSKYHWSKCFVCGFELSDKSKHIYSSVCDPTCNICGYKRKVTHTYATKWTKDGNYHWHVCTVCGTAGTKHKHIFDDCYDKNCNSCGYERGILHSYSDVITKATLTKNGSVKSVCGVCGRIRKTTTVYYPKTIKLSKTSYIYSGDVRKPSVSVKDSKGKTISKTNYSVTYQSGRKYVGKYKVTVKFKGDKYKGTKYLYFKINPEKTSIVNLCGIIGGFKVTVKKQTVQTTGYQIRYSVYKSFKKAKTVTIKSNKTVTKTITDVTPGKQYYVQVRTYKSVDGERFYSAWN